MKLVTLKSINLTGLAVEIFVNGISIGGYEDLVSLSQTQSEWMQPSMSKLTDQRTHFKPFNWAYGIVVETRTVALVTRKFQWQKMSRLENHLTQEEKSFLTNIFRFFTQGDIDVAGGYVTNYLHTFHNQKFAWCCGFAAREEKLHICILTLDWDFRYVESTYIEFLEYEAMKEKHDYFMDLSNPTVQPSVATNILRSVRSLKVCSCSVRLSCCWTSPVMARWREWVKLLHGLLLMRRCTPSQW